MLRALFWMAIGALLTLVDYGTVFEWLSVIFSVLSTK